MVAGLFEFAKQRLEKLVLGRGGLMNPGKHVAHVAHGIVRVELDRSRIAVRTTLGERVYEELDDGVASRVTVLVQYILVQDGTIC